MNTFLYRGRNINFRYYPHIHKIRFFLAGAYVGTIITLQGKNQMLIDPELSDAFCDEFPEYFI